MAKSVIESPRTCNEEDCNFYECLECNQAILNPIGPRCILKEVSTWFENQKIPSKKILKEINNYLEKNKNFEEDSETCIKCGKKNVYVCPSCFINFISEILEKERVSNEIIAEFEKTFEYKQKKFDR